MIYPINHLPQTIPVGVQTEKGVEVVGFDLKPWLDVFPDMNFTVWPTRPGEDESYPAGHQEISGTVLYWFPDDYDTAFAGNGRVEIAGVDDEHRKASGFVTTSVRATSLGTTKEPGEAASPWYENVINAAKDAETSANEAMASKEAAEAAAGHAQSLFVIHIGTDLRGSSQEEVRAAVNAKKTVLAVYYNGRVYHYVGERETNESLDNGEKVPTFYSNASYEDANLEYEYAQLLSNGKWSIRTRTDIRVPNPECLAFTGAVKGLYDGSQYMAVHIPDSNTFVVTAVLSGRGYVADRSKQEIDTAVSNGKACFLRLGDGVYVYAGDYRFVRSEYSTSHAGVFYDHAIINDDKTINFGGYGPYSMIPVDLLGANGFLRWDGIMWQVVTIADLKNELGLT